MIARDYEPLFPVLEELDVALVAFSPLGNSFLSGAYNANDKFAESVDFRNHMPQYIMGHANITMTLNYYVHATYDSAKAEMERLAA